MRIIQTGVYCFALLLSSWAASGVFAQTREASVNAELSQASITFGDSVALTVSARNLDADLDIGSLDAQFNVTGRSSSREVRFVNGVETVLVNWVIQIEPKQSGVLTVPPVTVGNLRTQPLALNVGEPPTGNSRVLFIEAFVDTENPYVQSQVLMTIKVWQSIKVLESNKVNLGSDAFQTVALERDKEYLETRDGKEYLVQEQQFSLFPTSSGVHTFGPIELRAKIPVNNSRVQGFFSPTRSVKRLSQPITFNVRPRPSSVQGQWWLPASNVQIRDSWSGDPSNINANDTITRTIEIVATGVSSDQLPDIEPPAIDGLKLYADNIDRSSVGTDLGIVSTQKVTWAVVPERNGEIVVPPLRLNWFNTKESASEVAELPAQTLIVNGLVDQLPPTAASGLTAGTDGGTVNNESGDTDRALIGPGVDTADQLSSRPKWIWLLIGALGLLMVQALGYGLWRFKKFRSDSSKTELSLRLDATRIPSLQKVSAAAKSNKLPDFQNAVLQWAGEFWPQTPPSNLLNVATRLREQRLITVFSEVDAALYGARTSDQPIYLLDVEKLMHSSASQIVSVKKSLPKDFTTSQLPAL